MTPIPKADIPDEVLEYNRERYKAELAQGIYELMERHGLNQRELADLLGVDKSRITHILAAGDHNFEAETVADIFLVLGRAAHLTLGTDIGRVRFPIDEAETKPVTVSTHHGQAPKIVRSRSRPSYRRFGSTKQTYQPIYPSSSYAEIEGEGHSTQRAD